MVAVSAASSRPISSRYEATFGTDKHASYPEAFAASVKERVLPSDCKLRRVKYLNNIIEQDHRAIRRRWRAMQCFRSFHTAGRTIEGAEAAHMMRKGQVKRLDGRDAVVRAKFVESHAREFANQMATARREARSGGLDDAPSASAYWDQLWVEVETALAPAAQIKGAAEYLKELKVMIIYGRALTSAQAAIPPITQELAQANLLTKLAEDQGEAITEQIQTLQTGTASSALAVALWLRHRSVRRAVFTALQDFDAAHRYWALTVERPQRNPSRSIRDLADDLLDIAELQVSVQRALASFRPGPQPLKPSFEVPATAVADFLRDGSFAIRFTPDFGPVAGWGNVGRVRVQEVRAWVIWNEGKRPKSMEFTIGTDGDYYDQRVESGELKEFRFIGPRVNRTFRYDPVKADRSREDFITVHARVADDFRAQYSEPTLFTGWEFSLPKVKGIIDREALAALQGAVKGIELEFSGNYIKDADRFS